MTASPRLCVLAKIQSNEVTHRLLDNVTARSLHMLFPSMTLLSFVELHPDVLVQQICLQL